MHERRTGEKSMKGEVWAQGNLKMRVLTLARFPLLVARFAKELI